MKQIVAVLIAAVGATLLLAAGPGATAQRQFKVGYVIGAGDTPDTASLFGLPYAAFLDAVKAHHLDARVIQVAPNQDATGPLNLFGRQHYDLVIVGLPAPEALISVAGHFPNTKFVLPDFSRRSVPPGVRAPENIQGTLFKAGEAGYLAGYLAALMEKRRPGRDVIGAVAGYKFPGVDRWIVGYRMGAKRADPRIRVLTTYANNFTNPTKCKNVALAQIAQGAGALLNVAGGCGFGALEAAKEKGVWGIGVDVDQSFLGRHILTSAVIRLDVAVDTAIDRLLEGKLKTGSDTVFDLHNGGVTLGKVSPEVPASVLREVDDVRRQIVAGKIKVPVVT
jgi:basic membrane protein A and related proteins